MNLSNMQEVQRLDDALAAAIGRLERLPAAKPVVVHPDFIRIRELSDEIHDHRMRMEGTLHKARNV